MCQRRVANRLGRVLIGENAVEQFLRPIDLSVVHRRLRVFEVAKGFLVQRDGELGPVQEIVSYFLVLGDELIPVDADEQFLGGEIVTGLEQFDRPVESGSRVLRGCRCHCAHRQEQGRHDRGTPG